MKAILCTLILMIVLASCGDDSSFKSELETVDSLQTELNKLQAKMDSADKKDLERNLEEVSSLNAYLLANYTDTMDRKFWVEDMSKMRRIQKAYDRFNLNYAEIEEKIKLSEKQLTGLENSLKDEKLEEGLAHQYLQTEKKAVAEIYFLVYKLQPEYMISRNIWQEMKPVISAKADSLKKFRSSQP